MSEFEKNVGIYIISALNLAHALFAIGLSIFGVYMGVLTSDIMGMGLGAVGLILGLLILFVAVKMLWPAKKVGWTYALILNIVAIPMYLFLPDFIPVYGITFAVLVILFMVIPMFREPYK
jgi:hypothetical protein